MAERVEWAGQRGEGAEVLVCLCEAQMLNFSGNFTQQKAGNQMRFWHFPEKQDKLCSRGFFRLFFRHRWFKKGTILGNTGREATRL